ncbi:putative metalloprotease [Actinoplanes lutulentus]|uniref:neutral zinc metallopeptidase n=1 Tax=Actinoplanes lutulentus TaxID=1287878 RepID=UPI0017F8E026|nr:neutral zinc metallopeptidase [Actinoplanes lutulentus]MBB2940590.1 putative metalloprotease [Actinoplanes lutulentus]
MAAALMLLIAACGDEPTTRPADFVNGPWTPTLVAGLTVTDGPSGLKPAGPAAQSQAENGDGGPADQLALAALDDVQAYWIDAFPRAFDAEYRPIRRVVSYDSATGGGQLCGVDTAGLVNAFYCSDDTVAWDRGVLLPDLQEQFGELAVVTVLAHEVGHAVASRLGDAGEGTASIVKEQQADCYTGAFFRSVAEGDADRFEVSTGPGLNQVLATLFAIRDSAGRSFDADGAHGNAFDRVTAFQKGFGEGPPRCRAIDEAEIADRITQQSSAQDGDADSQGADLGIGFDELADLETTLREAFQPLNEGRIDVDAAPCDGTEKTSPVSYCPGTDTVAVDLPELRRVGAAAQDGGFGDFAAFAEVASRFSLSVQQAAGLSLEGLLAAQRTACLTGAWAATIQADQQKALRLSPGDLDEAVAEMLTAESLIASDVSGASVPSGFARVKAFRDGFTAGIDNACAKQYR